MGKGCAVYGEIALSENRFIRSAPSAAGAVLGVAKRGERLPCGGRTTPEGWRLVWYRGMWGWVRVPDLGGYRFGQRVFLA